MTRSPLVPSVVRIVIGTYGSLEWAERAKTAVASAQAQTVECQVRHVHGETLAAARNSGSDDFDEGWIIHLDADDTLAPDYVEEMLKGTTDLRQPATLGVHPDGSEDPFPYVIPPAANLLARNHMVIGTMVRADLFHQVGGFHELPIYEDWELWVRCWLEGATIGVCENAVYRVGLHDDDDKGRNENDRSTAVRIYNEVRSQYLPIAQARGLI